MEHLGNKEIRIILVDDNIVFRNTLKKYLQEEFQFVVMAEASSGPEFFALSEYHLADVILMDLQMPEMDGYAVTKKILIDHRNMPIIAITMHAERAYLQELISVGFKGCVFKPEIYKNIQKAIMEVSNNKYYFPHEMKV